MHLILLLTMAASSASGFAVTALDDESAERAMDRRLLRVQQGCGVLCNTNRPTFGKSILGRQYNHTKAPVPCGWLLAEDTGIDAVREQRWPPVQPPPQWLDEFTMQGRFKVKRYSHHFFNMTKWEDLAGHSAEGGQMSDDSVTPKWQKADVQRMVQLAREKKLPSRYRHLERDLWSALGYIGVKGLNVLVIGSQTPWVEALALGQGAKHVWTLEYARLVTDHPDLSTYEPVAFLKAAREHRLPRFDVVVTASSVEHSGLGRYGDGLNPWGDILAVARAWCVSAPNARLVISVPTSASGVRGEATSKDQAKKNDMDRLLWNSQRVYGPVRYPYLTTNWRFMHRISGGQAMWGQSVYVFSKLRSEILGSWRPRQNRTNLLQTHV